MYARPGIDEQKIESLDQLNELYETVKRYCLFLTQNVWDGEDLAQEAFRKGIEHYGDQTELNAALLKRIAHNVWIDQLKKQNKEEIGLVTDKCSEEIEPSRDIMKMLSLLTPKQSAVFTLKEAFRFQISEIADMFNMTESGVKAILHRARRKLSKASSCDEELPSLQSVSENDEDISWENVLYHAIQSGDPLLLIKQIKLKYHVVERPIRKSSSPSSFLSMAA